MGRVQYRRTTVCPHQQLMMRSTFLRNRGFLRDVTKRRPPARSITSSCPDIDLKGASSIRIRSTLKRRHDCRLATITPPRLPIHGSEGIDKKYAREEGPSCPSSVDTLRTRSPTACRDTSRSSTPMLGGAIKLLYWRANEKSAKSARRESGRGRLGLKCFFHEPPALLDLCINGESPATCRALPPLMTIVAAFDIERDI